jgi:hypothetical protein
MTAARLAAGVVAGTAILWAGSALLRMPPMESVPLAVLAGVMVAFQPEIATWMRSRAKPVLPDPMAAILDENQRLVGRMRQALTQIEHVSAQAHVRIMADGAEAVIAQARQGALEPSFGARILSYYLPRASDIALAWPALEQTADHARQARALALMERLATLFAHAGAGRTRADLKTLDLDMELLDEALDQDLPGRTT